MVYSNSKLVALFLVSLLSIVSTARAGTFSWTWSAEDVAFDATWLLEGMFSTAVTSGSITEAGVTSHVYTASFGGESIFTVDLVNSTLAFTGEPVASIASFHDLGYTIGQDRFQSTNGSVSDASFPIDFSVMDDAGYFAGLYYEAGSQAWVLALPFDPPDDLVAFSGNFDGGFATGPSISAVAAVPEPEIYVTMLVGLGLVFSGLRARSRRDQSRRVLLG